jgi:transposase
MRFLTSEEEQALRLRHRQERDRLVCDRIKAVLLSNEGWTYIMIARALMLDEKTISTYLIEYKRESKLTHKNGGSTSKLSKEEGTKLITWLETSLYTKTQEICAYVDKEFGKKYTISGMRCWMRRNDFVYKKPKGFPGKAKKEAQDKFITFYNKLMNTTPVDEPILFGDSVHPTQATVLSYGWIRKGKEHYIPTTGQRTRLNFTGAINLETMDVFEKEYEKINGASFVDYLDFLQNKYPKAPKIHFIVDQGSAHKSKLVKAYLIKNPKICLHYLPPYSPNLNPIERLWKVMHEFVTYNKYYEKKEEFMNEIRGFFNKTVGNIKELLRDRVSDNFAPMKQ